MMGKLVVFSCDPGTKNFACSITEITYNKTKVTKIKVVGTCMLEDTLQDLTKGVADTLGVFRKRIRKILKKNTGDGKVDVVCFERFQSRGLKGKTIEAISFMLGQLAYVFKREDPLFILASTWKNRINRFEGIALNSIYKDYGLTLKATEKRDHELDATLIGIYAAHKKLGFADFSYFEQNDFDKFMKTFLKSDKLKY